MKKVSIIVPIYNSEKLLHKTIDSILSQSYENIEVLLLNDGSTDNSLGVCKSYSDSRIKIIDGENKGVSATRNIGLRNATGEYICFVDSDDYIEKDTIRLLVTNLEEYDCDISIIGYRMVWDNGSSQNMSNPQIKRVLNKTEALKNWFASDLFKGFMWDKLFKKELFENVQFPEDQNYMEDVLVGNQLFARSNKTIYDGTIMYSYFQSESSITGTTKNKKFLLGMKSIEEMVHYSERNNNLYDLEVKSRLLETSYKFICRIYDNQLDNVSKTEINQLINNIKKYRHFIFSKYISKADSFLMLLLLFNINPGYVSKLRNTLLSIKRALKNKKFK